MKLVHGVVLAAGLIALTFAAIACGGDDGDSVESGDATQPAATSTRAATAAATPTAAEATNEPAATAPAAPAPTAAATTPPSIDTLTVSAGDFAFSPNVLSVNGANDTAITLTNAGVAPHSLKVYRDAAYGNAVAGAETGIISGGESDAFTLTSTDIGGATQLFFRCEVHPSQMEGTIAVQ
jgi:plastocyanin